jgi:hypothetical protein
VRTPQVTAKKELKMSLVAVLAAASLIFEDKGPIRVQHECSSNAGDFVGEGFG